ncbi:YcaO-like family protein [Amycolatopsis sp. NBC_01307]|uniref:YcaO-like family protein n=1 Tax=Amycolatopsis sp. NBC_01307 TaxID=2903561 RepID=UPI002E1515F6|nr:YcaO-like family protein [Amycolatopsis sp. NBC_01307]
MPSDDVRPELTGVEVHDLEPALCLLITPNGGQYPIPVPAAEVRAWIARCDGTRTRAELLAGVNPGYAELLDVLTDGGGLRPATDGASRVAATTVLIAGTPELTAPLAQILAPAGYARVQTLSDVDGPFPVNPADAVVVAAFTHPAYSELTALDAFCADRGVRLLPFRCERGQGIAGPAITPGGPGPDFADVLDRRRSAATDPRVIDAFATADPPPGRRFRPIDARWMLTVLAVQLERWLAGEPAETTTGELELDPVRLSVLPRPVLPFPDRTRAIEARGPRPDLLVDDRTGIVTAVHEIPPAPGLPARLKVCAVDVADMHRVADWANDRRAVGTSWHDFDVARDAAIGKAVERYCGSWLPADRELRHASYLRLCRQGVPALDPRRLNLYSPRQYAIPGFPFAPLTPDTECAWIEAFSHTTREALWVPACLVSDRPEPDGARFTDPLLAGLAGGTSREHAVTSGLEAVLEQDTTMLWWANTPRLRRLPVPAGLRALIADTADTHDVTLIPLDNEFGVPVVAAAVLDRARRRLSIGTATRPDAFEAAKQALADGFARQHADAALDPRAVTRVAPWVLDLPVRPWEGLPSVAERGLKAYRERVEERGFEVISVDLTTRDVASAGFHAAHTIVPGLVPRFPAGAPYWGAGRIRRAAVDLGWRPAPQSEERLNVFPFPHA